MSSFDDFGKMIGDFAATTVQKTKDLTETGKLKLQINSVKTDLDESYRDLGKRFYDSDGQLGQDDAAGAFSQIEAYLEQIDQLQAQVDELRNVVVCPKCKERMEVGTAYCSNCGAELPKEPENEHPYI